MTVVSITVNGKKISKEVQDNKLLSDFLRDTLALTGTHIGCDTSQCGACVVHLNGNSIKSFTTLVADCNNSEITTIEGLAKNGKMHPMQEAFKKMHGLQCGFCTPGMVMSGVDLLKTKKDPSEKEIRDWLEGNICRCTGYQGIVAAVKDAASKMECKEKNMANTFLLKTKDGSSTGATTDMTVYTVGAGKTTVIIGLTIANITVGSITVNATIENNDGEHL